MSAEAMARAWAVDGLSASEKLVLLRLADWSNAEGLCWYSYAKLGAFVGLQRRQVLRVVAALADRGLVRVVSRFNEKTGLQMSNVLWVLPSDDRKPGDVLKDASNAVRGRLVDGDLQASEGVIQDTPRGVIQDTPRGVTQDTPRGVTQDTQNLQRNLQRNLKTVAGMVVPAAVMVPIAAGPEAVPRGPADVILSAGQMLDYLDTHLPHEAHSVWLARQSGPCASGAGTVPGASAVENR